MRTHRTGLAVALSLLISLAAIGQEPVADPYDVALADAARQNNFAEFDRLFQTNPLAAYSELHKLWSWSMNDPAGGFYGPETHDRLAASYPDFAAFIQQHKIVDSNGNAFYPTGETRAFLLSKAVRGVIAESLRPAKPAQLAKNVGASQSSAARPAVERAGMAKKELVSVAPPPPALESPLRTAALQTLPKPITSTPVVATRRPAIAAEPVVATVVPAAVAKPVSSDLGRGIFLIIAGLFGLGLVSVMLHTPAEEQTPTAHHP